MPVPTRPPDFSFTSIGEPAHAGNKTAGFNKATGKAFMRDQSGQKGKDWRSTVQKSAVEAMQGAGLVRSAVAIRIWFFYPRPKGDFGSGKNAGVLKPNASIYKETKPDWDKLSRALGDALSKVLYYDDNLVAAADVVKLFGDPARAEVEVWVLTPGDAPDVLQGRGDHVSVESMLSPTAPEGP